MKVLHLSIFTLMLITIITFFYHLLSACHQMYLLHYDHSYTKQLVTIITSTVTYPPYTYTSQVLLPIDFKVHVSAV